MVLTQSTKFKSGAYHFHGSKMVDSAIIIIEGNNIVIDFNNLLLIGSAPNESPDGFKGIAIKIKGGSNITIRNLQVKGYKVAVCALNTEGLKIENCDFSYNYRAHLNSDQEREDYSDWLSYHHNENDEWLRYGAAMYLRLCTGAIISNVKVTHGQNGLMMVSCSHALIFNNNFSYNSGIGIGLYKSSHNQVLYNKIDFNVRGYSEGVYQRGQDSAGILVYEQSNQNLFYNNSVTHGGDGFFLWAGQSSMDAGTGGCNDNVIKDNDFSYAVANGIEATFSRNQILHNRIFGCENGIWAGYSYQTRITQNQFRFNKTAIAIEHGQHNTIDHNLFYLDKTALKLWAGKEDTLTWGYPRLKDTRSKNYLITGNSFNQNQTICDFSNTDSIQLFNNRQIEGLYPLRTDLSVTHLDSLEDLEQEVRLSEDLPLIIPPISSPQNPFRGLGRLSGRQHIIMTPWGPYDFQYPLIWNPYPLDTSGHLELRVFGIKGGTWKIISTRGLCDLVRSTAGDTGKISATVIASASTDIEVLVSIKGLSFVDEWGKKIGKSNPYFFRYQKFFLPIPFVVKWYEQQESENLLNQQAPLDLTQKIPFKTQKSDRLDYQYWGAEPSKKNKKSFLALAEGSAQFPKGMYEFFLSWNSAIRVYLDGQLKLNDWQGRNIEEEDIKQATLQLNLEGSHHLRVEHFTPGGFSSIQLKIIKLQQLK
ncbi:MAG: hypothetical protein NVS1B13_17870 [Flavisolibacter sp.]